MNYVLEPSLQRTALVKVAAILWNQDDVKNSLEELDYVYYRECKSRREKIEAIVAEKVAKLPLPKQMKEKISCFIKPVGFQITQWKQFFNKNDHRVDLPNEFCWTSQGTIDKKKTAEVMIKDESIDIATRYYLACIHCLEDDIPKLWKNIPKSHRKPFYSTAYHYVLPVVEFWTYYIKKDKRKLYRKIKQEVRYRISPYEYAFKNAIHDNCIVAAEYFLQKLTVGEANLLRATLDIAAEAILPGNYYAEVLCFLFSYLDEEEQKRVFECIPAELLSSLLDYPLQHFFMETANYMWNFLTICDYVFILDLFTGKTKDGYKDFDYQKLLGEFWQKIPIDHKRHVLSHSMFYSIISDLFEIRDEDNIRLIFKDATLEEKKCLFYDSAQDICETLLNGDDPLSLLKYFIRECLPSKDEVIGFKEHFEWGEIGELQFKFLRVLDKVIGEFKKRKHEEEDDGKDKKM